MKRLLVFLILIALVLAGCAQPYGPKEGAGTVIGAGTGALLGAQLGHGTGRMVAVAIGTLAGALIGQEIGRSLDRADELAMKQNAQYALEYTPTTPPPPGATPIPATPGRSPRWRPTRTRRGIIAGNTCKPC